MVTAHALVKFWGVPCMSFSLCMPMQCDGVGKENKGRTFLPQPQSDVGSVTLLHVNMCREVQVRSISLTGDPQWLRGLLEETIEDRS